MADLFRSALPYRSVDIYFIYSFVIEVVPPVEIADQLWKLGWSKGRPDDRIGRPAFLRLQRRTGPDTLRPRDASRRLFESKPTTIHYEERDRIESDSGWRLGDATREDLAASVEAFARLFDNGTGCITFRVRLEGDVDFRRIYCALSLSQRLFDRSESLAKFRIGEVEGSLFAHFRHHLQQLQDEINGAIRGLEKPAQLVLQDEELLNFDDEQHDAQNPYVLSVVELDASKIVPNLFALPATERLEHKELAAIMFRLVYPGSFFEDLQKNLKFVRIPDELLVDGDYLRNYAWDHRSLMCFSRTSSLFACTEKDRIPAVLIKNSLLDTLEIVRTRWHMSVLLNAQLDHDLDAFRTQDSDKSVGVLRRLIRRRQRFAAYLHDPLPYAFEGGSVSKVGEVASAEMQLPMLRQMTFEKLATLDQLHEDHMKVSRITDYRAFDEVLHRARARRADREG